MEYYIWSVFCVVCFSVAGWFFGKHLGESYTIEVRCIKEAEKFFKEEEKQEEKDDSSSE